VTSSCDHVGLVFGASNMPAAQLYPHGIITVVEGLGGAQSTTLAWRQIGGHREIEAVRIQLSITRKNQGVCRQPGAGCLAGEYARDVLTRRGAGRSSAHGPEARPVLGGSAPIGEHEDV